MSVYSQRMLNPFHGVVNTVVIPGAAAESQDGLHWFLYVDGEAETQAGGIPLPDIKYGSWSSLDGLKRAPVPPIPNYGAVEAAGQRLLAAVRAHLDEVPFPLADRYELWLLEKDTHEPLALIASAIEGEPLEMPEPAHWRAGQLARALFRLEEAQDKGAPAPSEQLARLVNAAAGEPARAQWFRREGDRAVGLAVPGGHEPLQGRVLPAGRFPPLLVRTRWHDPQAQRLVHAFLAWQAPYLLQLSHLDPATRAALERDACARPSALAERFRLYPTFVDQDRLLSALVAQRLRAAAGEAETEEPASPPLAPFFNE